MAKSLKLWLLLGVFVLPVVSAWVLLRQGWYQGGVTNRGELLASPVSFAWLRQPEPQWQILYAAPPTCDDACQGAMFNLRQVPQVVGESAQRLQSRVLLSKSETRPQVKHSVIDANSTAVSAAPENRVAALNSYAMTAEQQAAWAELPFGEAAIYIVDPLGNVVMAYPVVEGKVAILAQGKDIVRDLKRLLKVSRIG
uniref:hypothetical protein n=1 Tax=Thaumasiovibrio occultus TaxID=1891184 RepID=UPI000B3601A2|nr:hypothetical protein [Thaumasiovibrio occultus]